MKLEAVKFRVAVRVLGFLSLSGLDGSGCMRNAIHINV